MQSAERSHAAAAFKVAAPPDIRDSCKAVENLNRHLILMSTGKKGMNYFFSGEGQYSPLSALSSNAHSSAVYTHAACDNQKHESTALIATRPFH